jgi:hypothetical protein
LPYSFPDDGGRILHTQIIRLLQRSSSRHSKTHHADDFRPQREEEQKRSFSLSLSLFSRKKNKKGQQSFEENEMSDLQQE